MENTNALYSNWKQLKGKVKKQWGELTDNDVQAIDGNTDELIGRLISTYGYTKEYAQQAIEHFLSNNNLSESFTEIKKKFSEQSEEVKENFEKYSNELGELIKKSPLQSIMIAGAIGILSGLLLKIKK